MLSRTAALKRLEIKGEIRATPPECVTLIYIRHIFGSDFSNAPPLKLPLIPVFWRNHEMKCLKTALFTSCPSSDSSPYGAMCRSRDLASGDLGANAFFCFRSLALSLLILDMVQANLPPPEDDDGAILECGGDPSPHLPLRRLLILGL